MTSPPDHISRNAAIALLLFALMLPMLNRCSGPRNVEAEPVVIPSEPWMCKCFTGFDAIVQMYSEGK